MKAQLHLLCHQEISDHVEDIGVASVCIIEARHIHDRNTTVVEKKLL
jgi:hypothetical protein